MLRPSSWYSDSGTPRFRLSRTTDPMRITSGVRTTCDNPSPSPAPRSVPLPVLRPFSPHQAPSIACSAPPICTLTPFSYRRRLSYPCRHDDPLRHPKLESTHLRVLRYYPHRRRLRNAQLRDPRKGSAAVFSARSPRIFTFPSFITRCSTCAFMFLLCSLLQNSIFLVMSKNRH
jgi:hypothetical protein